MKVKISKLHREDKMNKETNMQNLTNVNFNQKGLEIVREKLKSKTKIDKDSLIVEQHGDGMCLVHVYKNKYGMTCGFASIKLEMKEWYELRKHRIKQ